MIVSTTTKALLLPKYGDSSDRPVISEQSQGVGWVKEDHDGRWRRVRTRARKS